MNKKLTIIIILANSAIFCLSQDYRCIYPGDTTYYVNKFNSVLSMRIVKAEADDENIRIYHLPGTIRKKDTSENKFGCYTPYGASWLGSNYFVLKGSEHRFYPNVEYENPGIPFILFTDREIDQSWTCYAEPDQDSATARIISVDTMSFLGVTDSVKIIEIKGHYQDENINNNIDGKQIIISKNYGLVKTLNFYLFPGAEPEFPLYEQMFELDLVGSNRIPGSIDNLTWMEVYDFQAGDQIHEIYLSESFNIYDNLSQTRREKSIIKNVLVRSEEIDMVIYTIEQTWKEEITHSIRPGEYSTGRDTFKVSYGPNPEFDYLPGEPIVNEGLVMEYSMNLNPFPSKIRAPDYMNQFNFNETDSCGYLGQYDGCFPDRVYYEGLGGPFGYCDDNFNGGFSEHKLVYYKKGEETWGTPLNINLSVKHRKIPKSLFLVYPIPAEDLLIIRNMNQLSNLIVEFTEITGNFILTQDLELNTTSIYIENWEPGIYFFRVIRKGEILDSGKIIKH